MTKENEPTIEGIEKIRRFHRAEQRIDHLKKDLGSWESELEAASAEVVAWLAPPDAVLNETFSIAVGEAFLNVRVIGEKKFEVSWRNGKRPRRL